MRKHEAKPFPGLTTLISSTGLQQSRLKDDRTFTVGVQWYAEWKPEEHALSRALFGEFGRAAHAHARDRQETLVPSRAQSAAAAAS